MLIRHENKGKENHHHLCTKSDWFEARKSNCITIFTPKTHDIGTHFEKSRNDPQFPTLTKNIPWYHILVFKGSRPLPSTT